MVIFLESLQSWINTFLEESKQYNAIPDKLDELKKIGKDYTGKIVDDKEVEFIIVEINKEKQTLTIESLYSDVPFNIDGIYEIDSDPEKEDPKVRISIKWEYPIDYITAKVLKNAIDDNFEEGIVFDFYDYWGNAAEGEFDENGTYLFAIELYKKKITNSEELAQFLLTMTDKFTTKLGAIIALE